VSRRRIWTSVTLLLAAAALTAGPTAGSSAQAAEFCTTTVVGSRGIGASFVQEATFDFCDGHVARVGVRVTPYGSYRGSNINNCVAHLELTSTTLGEQTRSDRPINCTVKARAGAPFAVGPRRTGVLALDPGRAFHRGPTR
jgi:hypothetical protein